MIFLNNSMVFLFFLTSFIWNAEATTTAPKIEPSAWLILDESGMIIAGHEINKKHAPASLTKLLTSYLVMDSIRNNNLQWNESILVTPKALGSIAKDETQMYLVPGDKVKVKDLMLGLVVASANDAAAVLSSHIGNDFVKRMNAKAKQLGLKNSHFATPSGITTSGQFSTALDIGRLSLRLTKDYPEFISLSSQQNFSYRSFRKKNTNTLLAKNRSVDGLKTGYTREAGWNIVVSARRKVGTEKSHRIFAVVLGAPSAAKRDAYAQELIEYGFASLKKKSQLAHSM